MSLVTKRAIAQSLKKLASLQPLSKLTIKQITDDCGINRQTFYYHFHDIFDLVEWIYAEDAARAIGSKKTYNTWQQGYLGIFEYVRENRNFILRTYHSLSREHLENFLYSQSYRLLIDVINEKAEGILVKEEDKSFIANFYKYGFVGLLLDWIKMEMQENPEHIIDQLNTLICGNVEKALGKFTSIRTLL